MEWILKRRGPMTKFLDFSLFKKQEKEEEAVTESGGRPDEPVQENTVSEEPRKNNSKGMGARAQDVEHEAPDCEALS